MKIKPIHAILPVALAVFTVIAFQNCSPGFEVMQDSEASTFKAADSCVTGNSDACLFRKNAVSQMGKPVTADRIGGYQTQSAKIQDLDGSGMLQNADIIVTTSFTPRISGNRFRHYYSPSNSNLEQVMTYYYANDLRRWMLARGVFAGAGAGITFVVDSTFSGWVPSKKEVHLEREGGAFPAALDGSLIANFYAEANIWAATTGASHTGISTSTIACANAKGVQVPNGCCATASGCGPAIVRGSADYLTAALFADSRSTAIGEGWKNSLAGLSVCGLSRDPAAQSALTATMASNRCGARGSTNQINAMGILYASIWWEARKKAADKNDFDKFFLRHLAEIKGDSTFTSIKTAIMSLDAAGFSSRYSAIMTAEFTRRGL